MPLFVAKFGGTSLMTGERYLSVAKIALDNPSRRVLIASAPGKRSPGDSKITDLFLLYHRTRDDDVYRMIEDRFFEIGEKTGCSSEDALFKIRRDIASGASEAYAMSRGEYLSAKALAHAAGFVFLDSKDMFLFSDGVFQEEATLRAIRKCIDPEKRYVIPGFYGADERGNICLFPRGGSDVTGAVAARALKADLYENWTDVDGVYDTPPECAGAKKLRIISYQDMQNLCRKGACVLHADSIQPVKDASIPIHVRSSFQTSVLGTLICRNPQDKPPVWFIDS